MDVTIVLLLLFLSAVFFLVELFFLPGISVAGVAALLFAGAAVFYAYTISPVAGHLTLAGSFVVAGLGVWLFIRSKTLERISLKTDIDSRIEPLKDMDIRVGDKGITVSRLAPMGQVKIAGRTVRCSPTWAATTWRCPTALPFVVLPPRRSPASTSPIAELMPTATRPG